MSAVLEVRRLEVSYRGRSGPVPAVRGVDVAVGARERLGIVGESGSGKSTVARAVLKLLPETATIRAEAIRLGGTDLLRADEAAMRAVRGRRIGLVLQDPRYSLNPTRTVGEQIAEGYRAHFRAGRRAARERALEMLEAVRIREPARVYGLYPHEVSGGMGQRVMIAMMLALEPEVLVADEPTSALDVTVQAQVLELLERLAAERGMALVLVSHNLALVGAFCDRVAVMYAGRVVESVEARDLLRAEHPYTRGLLACRPLIDEARDELPTLARDPRWAA